MILDDSVLEEIILENDFLEIEFQQSHVAPNFEIKSEISENIDLTHHELLHQIILLKKQNNFYKKRIKFLDSLLTTKRIENSFSNYIKNELISHISEKDKLLKSQLINENSSMDVLYTISDIHDHKSRTEKRKAKKTTNNLNKSHNKK